MEEKLLASLGLNAKEVKIFKAVLRAREISPAQLAKSTGVKRTTCYSLARGLAEKGFLVESAGKRPRTFSIAQASHVETSLKAERERLATREKALKRFTNELSRATAEEDYPVPQVRFVEERKLEQFQLSEISHWHESAMKRDKTWWGFQDHTWVDTFGHLIPSYWKNAPKDLQLKFLSNREGSPAEAKLLRKFPGRAVKYWNKTSNFISSLWVVGDYVVILNTRRHPFYLFEMYDETLANDLREVFKNLWVFVK